MTAHNDFIARGLVRSYSDNLRSQQRQRGHEEPEGSRRRLENAFCEEVERQDALASLLQEAMSSRLASQKLKARYEELEEAMKAFQDAFPEAKITEGTNRAISWSSLFQAVADLRQQHDEKSRKSFMHQPKKRFHRVCDVINNHSNALKILPQGDKYTSIIIGSIETITKASVNYVHVGEDFVTALEEIDRIVTDVQAKLTLYRESYLEDLSIQLCCKILAFVTFPLKWYSQKGWKRAKGSLNENLSVEYGKHVQAIRSISDAIQRGAQLCTAQEIRGVSQSVVSLPEKIDNISDLFKYWMEIQELHQRENWKRNEQQWESLHRANQEQNERLQDGRRYLENMSQHFSTMFDKSIGPPMKQILDREAQQFAAPGSDQSLSPHGCSFLEASITTRSVPGVGTAAIPSTIQTKGQVEETSTMLDKFFDYDQILVRGSEIDTFAEIDAIQQLQSWTTQAQSSIMALYGPASLGANSSSQLIASNYVQAARAAGIPSVSYFCSTTHEAPPKGRLRETIGLVSLTYALMKQLIRHIPLQWTTRSGPTLQKRFAELDGTLRTGNAALTLFKELLDLCEPPLLLIVIHGIEILEHEATNDYLAALVGVLRRSTQEIAAANHSERIIKVLLTTSGVSRVLGSALTASETFDNNRGEAARSPGQARKGRRNVSDVSFPGV